MARSTKAEIKRRLAELAPLVCDCMTVRELRAWVDAKTAWGPEVCDATLKYYMKRCRAQMKGEASFDRSEELGVTKRRLERIIARAAAKGDLRTELAATRQHSDLLGLGATKHSEQPATDIEAARQALEAEIAKEMAQRGSRRLTFSRARGPWQGGSQTSRCSPWWATGDRSSHRRCLSSCATA